MVLKDYTRSAKMNTGVTGRMFHQGDSEWIVSVKG